jgi:hypothetical protein
MVGDKYISSYQIIDKLISDADYTQADFNEIDLITWIGDCLDFIKHPSQLLPQIALITVKNQKGPLPCNYYERVQLAGVTSAGKQFPMRESTGTFHPLFVNTDPKTGAVITTSITTDGNGNPTFDFNNPNTFSFNQSNLGIDPTLSSNDYMGTYKVNDNYIFTNFKEGRVLLSYLAFPCDDNGYPLIPDEISYREAVYNHLKWKLDYKLWRKGKISDKIYQDSARERDWYISQAQGKAMNLHNIDKLESWKNQSMQWIPRVNAHDNFFNSLGQAAQMTFGNRNIINGNSTTVR